MNLFRELAELYPNLAGDFAQREEVGDREYKRPLDPFREGADWPKQWDEELSDAMVYMTAELHLLADAKRTDADARHRYLRIKQHRATLAFIIEDLRRG